MNQSDEEYPEHIKLHKVKPQADIISPFLEWLQEKGYHICTWDDKRQDYYTTNKGIEALLADYFEVDLKKISNEKDAMVEDLRKMNTTIRMDT